MSVAGLRDLDTPQIETTATILGTGLVPYFVDKQSLPQFAAVSELLSDGILSLDNEFTGDNTFKGTSDFDGDVDVLTGNTINIADLDGLTIGGVAVEGSAAELNVVADVTAGTQAATKAVVADANVNTGVSKVTELHVGATGSEVKIDATPAELNTKELFVTMADISTGSSVWIPSPVAGAITAIYTIINAAIATADALITAEINTVAVTDSTVTIAYNGSAAGDVDSSTPSAANVVAVGDKIEIITNGASTNTCIATIVVVITL